MAHIASSIQRTAVNHGMLTVDLSQVTLQDVQLSDEALTVDLMDGRSISVPLAWYPRLWQGMLAERNNWRLIGRGSGIHWPDLDEDISVESIILGRPSNESQSSLRRWLDLRR